METVLAPPSAFAKWLIEQMRLKGFDDNKSKLAQYSGIPYGTVSAWFNRGTIPSPDHCRTLAAALKLPVETVRKAGGPSEG